MALADTRRFWGTSRLFSPLGGDMASFPTLIPRQAWSLLRICYRPGQRVSPSQYFRRSQALTSRTNDACFEPTSDDVSRRDAITRPHHTLLDIMSANTHPSCISPPSEG